MQKGLPSCTWSFCTGRGRQGSGHRTRADLGVSPPRREAWEPVAAVPVVGAAWGRGRALFLRRAHRFTCYLPGVHAAAAPGVLIKAGNSQTHALPVVRSKDTALRTRALQIVSSLAHFEAATVTLCVSSRTTVTTELALFYLNWDEVGSEKWEEAAEARAQVSAAKGPPGHCPA